jgi:hypothetical protein
MRAARSASPLPPLLSRPLDLRNRLTRSSIVRALSAPPVRPASELLARQPIHKTRE